MDIYPLRQESYVLRVSPFCFFTCYQQQYAYDLLLLLLLNVQV